MSEPQFTKSIYEKPELTWYGLEPEWASAGCVLGGAVGPRMIPAYEHLLCDHFAVSHPESKAFLLGKLSDANPYLAAYAFKCLIRLPNFERNDLPESVLSRQERVSVRQGGCRAHEMKLRDFFLGYFGECSEEEYDDVDETES